MRVTRDFEFGLKIKKIKVWISIKSEIKVWSVFQIFESEIKISQNPKSLQDTELNRVRIFKVCKIWNT